MGFLKHLFTLFTGNNQFKFTRLLKNILFTGHLAYINYVRMEHWYNNSVVNGFCEMLIESMLYSQIYRLKFDIKASHSVTLIQHPEEENKQTLKFERTLSQQPKKLMQSVSVTERTIQTRSHFNFRARSETGVRNIKNWNPDFQFRSFLRLRNLLYLCLMLKSNPSLRKLRHHYLLKKSKEEQDEEVEVAKFSVSLNNTLGKIITKAKEKIIGSANKVNISKVSLTDSYFKTEDNESDSTSVDIKYQRHVEFSTMSSERSRRTRRGSL